MRVRSALPSAICAARDACFLRLDSRPFVAGLQPGPATPRNPSWCLRTPSSLQQSSVQLSQEDSCLSRNSRKGKPSTY